MGLFDLLRGYAPIGPEDFAINPDNWLNDWAQSSAPPPSWLPDPAAFGWPDTPGLMLLPNRLGTGEGTGTTLMRDRSGTSLADTPYPRPLDLT